MFEEFLRVKIEACSPILEISVSWLWNLKCIYKYGKLLFRGWKHRSWNIYSSQRMTHVASRGLLQSSPISIYDANEITQVSLGIVARLPFTCRTSRVSSNNSFLCSLNRYFFVSAFYYHLKIFLRSLQTFPNCLFLH